MNPDDEPGGRDETGGGGAAQESPDSPTDPWTGAVELVDARGLRCPLPVIRAAQRARDLPAGTRLRVVSTDPATEFDLPAWARMRGHRVMSLAAGDVVDITIELLDPP